MNVVIIEDEASVAQNLTDILYEIAPEITILVVLESIRDSIKWFANNPEPDIAFFDIKIADGHSFEILEKITINFPIIFTTAFDAYALQAFKYNSIDYLLKPIKKSDLEKAILKYKNLCTRDASLVNYNTKLIDTIKKIKESSKNPIYKKSFLVTYRNQLIPIDVAEIAYFFLENQIVYCKTHNNNCYQISTTLEKLEKGVDPTHFFRVNRQCIIAKQAVKSVEIYEHRKLKVIPHVAHSSEIYISKLKATRFKNWLHEK
jgi:DNA-binding LytR/AlgR family response regulator